MIDLRPVLHTVGIVLTCLALAMLVPAALDSITGHAEWSAFALSSGITLFCGLALTLSVQAKNYALNARQTFLTAVLCWIAPCLFAALPLFTSPATHLSPLDAFFEATSGLTTTGASVLTNLDSLPYGILLWRSMLQWMGGIGVILMALAILPSLNIGGMQIFGSETPSSGNRISARVLRQAVVIVGIYCALSILLSLALWLAGMSRFDSIAHAMTTLSTGGFSTHDASLAFYHDSAIDIVACVGMILGSLPFLLYLRTLQGEWTLLAHDNQIRLFLILLISGIAANTLWLINSNNILPLTALRHSATTIISIMTGTGLTTLNFSHWVALPATILFLLGFIGGCAGSTTSGIRVFRLQILLSDALMQVRRLLRPHGVHLPLYQGQEIPKEILTSTMGFLFIYALSYALIAILLGALGLDFTSALSVAGSAIANIGPGLGDIFGAGKGYADLNTPCKIVVILGMLLGRLEMVTIFVLFLPTFWKP